MSVGTGLTFVPVTLIATTNIGSEDADPASGLFNTAQQICGARGLAVLSTIASSRTSSVLGGLSHKASGSQKIAAVVDGYQIAFMTSAGLIPGGDPRRETVTQYASRRCAGPLRSSSSPRRS